MKKMVLVNRIGFNYHDAAIRWKEVEKKNPREEYKNCEFVLRMNEGGGCRWILEIWKEIEK